VAGEDEQIVGVDSGLLHRVLEQVVRVRDDKLVEGGAGGHQDGDREAAPASRTAPLLPGAREGAGIPHEHGGHHLADVDPQFKRVRRRHRPDRPAPESRFDPSALGGKVSGPVPADGVGIQALAAGALLKIGRQQFRGKPRAREEDRLDTTHQQFVGERHRFPDRIAADAEGPVHDRRIVEADDAFSARRPTLIDQRHRPADQPLSVLLGVADRGRAADELRCASIELADAEQAAQHVREVRAEHPAVVVELVKDDVAEVLEQPQPLRVVGEDRGVQHVGVRHDDVARCANGPARVGRRVPVIGEDFEVVPQRSDKRVELVHLIG